MCGIVGLHLKKPALYPRLGAWLTPMLLAMSERGPDSAGIALYEDGLPEGSYRYFPARSRPRLRLGGPGPPLERTAGQRDSDSPHRR